MEFDYPAFPIVWHKHWQVLVSELWNQKKRERERVAAASAKPNNTRHKLYQMSGCAAQQINKVRFKY